MENRQTKIKEVVLTSAGNPCTIDPSRKIFGTNDLKNREDATSLIMGGIVEKNISKSFTPAPSTTVLPFPVARHRSHGPHWEPSQTCESVVDGEGDPDVVDLVSVSSFANPVQRKQKAVLNLKQWREMVTEIDYFETKKFEKVTPEFQTKQNISDRLSMEKVSEPCFKSDRSSEASFSSPDHIVALHRSQAQDGIKSDTKCLASDLRIHELELRSGDLDITGEVAYSNIPKQPGNGLKSVSLQSEIDAENTVLLQKMSHEEVVEAQAEILHKLSPSLVTFLKKRGIAKEKTPKRFSNVPRDHENDKESVAQRNPYQNMWNLQNDVNRGNDDGKESSMEMLSSAIKDAKSQDKNSKKRIKANDSVSWNGWSQRVEAVRYLRFSFEGSVVPTRSEAAPMLMKDGLGDNVAERDILRSNGDPAAAGYTIKEAVQLTRSVIPGQRSLALHLIASVLNRAVYELSIYKIGCHGENENQCSHSVDWEAVWAYALGPEPEISLSLRLCLDDNHNLVVFACAKVVHGALTCDLNKSYFHTCEKMGNYEKSIFTAPVFRTKSEINSGFLLGRFWKYSAKPSTILKVLENVPDDGMEEKRTIGDDIVVAGQDFIAGLVRMGLLQKLRYLLEGNPSANLEECVISIIVAVARHSPTCAKAVLACPRLVNSIVERFTTEENGGNFPCKIESVCLLKVLAQVDKAHCTEFLDKGYFQRVTWHLFQPFRSLEQWMALGKERCKSLTSLMVEQLRYWKVCIQHGCNLTYFPTIFASLCLWLNRPTWDKLLNTDLFCEYTSVSAEGFLVLEMLARNLPYLQSQKQLLYENDDKAEIWSWSYVNPVVDLALTWMKIRSDPFVCKVLGLSRENYDDHASCSLLWVYSSVLRMLHTLLQRVTPDTNVTIVSLDISSSLLPKFVSKTWMQMIKQEFLSSCGTIQNNSLEMSSRSGSLVEALCNIKQQGQHETSLASSSCLYWFFCTMSSIDNLLNNTEAQIDSCQPRSNNSSTEESVAVSAKQRGRFYEMNLIDIIAKQVSSGWLLLQSIEVFGRGGPAPGAGVGWGTAGGGFWSIPVLSASLDAKLLFQLLTCFSSIANPQTISNEDLNWNLQKINYFLQICLCCGPGDRSTVLKVFDVLFGVPCLKKLGACIQKIVKLRKHLVWEYTEDDYMLFSDRLSVHFKMYCLSSEKKKPESIGTAYKHSDVRPSLATIHEVLDSHNASNNDSCCFSLTTEWTRQRFPLPCHWFLSSVATIPTGNCSGVSCESHGSNTVQASNETAKSGLFFILGIEAMASTLSVDNPVQIIPIVWKLHSLSVLLLPGMDILEDEKSRSAFELLQSLYGELLDRARSPHHSGNKCCLSPGTTDNHKVEILQFRSEVHENYPTFVEVLVEQFSSISYGDQLFGRQVAMYLHRDNEVSVRLAAWNALAKARVLDILPPLDKCFAEADGYLYPFEDNDSVLDAYVKSWISGALDRAATRGTMAFTLVLHHVSAFIFASSSDRQSLRSNLVRTLLRDCFSSRKRQGMMLDLIRFGGKRRPLNSLEHLTASRQGNGAIAWEFHRLLEACSSDSSLIEVVQKLRLLS